MGTEPPGIEWRGVCLDCVDAEKMATFYGCLLGWPFTGRDTPEDRKGGAGWVGMKDPKGGVGLSFQAEEWYQPPKWPEEEELQAKMSSRQPWRCYRQSFHDRLPIRRISNSSSRSTHGLYAPPCDAESWGHQELTSEVEPQDGRPLVVAEAYRRPFR